MVIFTKWGIKDLNSLNGNNSLQKETILSQRKQTEIIFSLSVNTANSPEGNANLKK